MAYATLAELRTYLGIAAGDTADDALLTALIARAQKEIDGYCGWSFEASGSTKRSGRMAIHEIVISLGLTIGSAAGGYLCDRVGLYAPYWFAVGVIILGLAGQVIIHFGTRARMRLPASGPASGNVDVASPS